MIMIKFIIIVPAVVKCQITYPTRNLQKHSVEIQIKSTITDLLKTEVAEGNLTNWKIEYGSNKIDDHSTPLYSQFIKDQVFLR